MDTSHRDLFLITNAKSRSISAENPSGEKGGGAHSVAGVAADAAKHLGRGWKVDPFIRVEPGETRVLADIEGPGVIRSMWFTGCLGRDYILRVYWDGQQTPSVQTPLCDFFGAGWQDDVGKVKMPFAPLNSAMIANHPCNGFNSYWPMPFAKHCLITIENRGEKRAVLYYQINYELCDIPGNSAYFHAQWRRTNPMPKRTEYTVLDGVEGRGHYVGVMLNVGVNGQNLWWGEGEMKFYLDGDGEFPTVCGTGTEDYFGGAWCWEVDGRYVSYSGLYAGVHFIHEPTGAEDCQQRFSMYRWHVADPIRFEQNIRVALQDLGWAKNARAYLDRSDDFSSVAYWYQTLPTSPFSPLPDRFDMEVL